MGKYIKPRPITRKQAYNYLVDNFYISDVLAALIANDILIGHLDSSIFHERYLDDLIVTRIVWARTILGYEFWANMLSSLPMNLYKTREV